MVIAELFHTGLLYMFLCFSEPIVWIPACTLFLLGLAVQLVILWKCRRRIWRVSVFGLGCIGTVICECLWHLQAGWGRLLITVVCLLLITFVSGALAAVIFAKLSCDKSLG